MLWTKVPGRFSKNEEWIKLLLVIFDLLPPSTVVWLLKIDCNTFSLYPNQSEWVSEWEIALLSKCLYVLNPKYDLFRYKWHYTYFANHLLTSYFHSHVFPSLTLHTMPSRGVTIQAEYKQKQRKRSRSRRIQKIYISAIGTAARQYARLNVRVYLCLLSCTLHLCFSGTFIFGLLNVS